MASRKIRTSWVTCFLARLLQRPGYRLQRRQSHDHLFHQQRLERKKKKRKKKSFCNRILWGPGPASAWEDVLRGSTCRSSSFLAPSESQTSRSRAEAAGHREKLKNSEISEQRGDGRYIFITSTQLS